MLAFIAGGFLDLISHDEEITVVGSPSRTELFITVSSDMGLKSRYIFFFLLDRGPLLAGLQTKGEDQVDISG